MIGKLSGTIDSVSGNHVIVDVGGVGYVVTCSARTLRALGAVGDTVALRVETQVREDAIRLFGFGSDIERDWFRLLQSVQGVGAKVALALQGILSMAELAQAIALQDKTAVSRAPGVGPKLAARILAELKDKAPAAAAFEPIASAASLEVKLPNGAEDAVSALVNLGYGRPQAVAAVAASVKVLGAEADAGALIRQGLKELAQ